MKDDTRLKWMDSGLALFRVRGGLDEATGRVVSEMERGGGRTSRTAGTDSPARAGAADILLDYSTPWRRRFIAARIEESGQEGSALRADERVYAVMFKEANGNTRLRTLALIILSIVLLFAAGFLPWRWCRVVCAAAVIIACLLLLSAPDDRCRKRCEQIIRNLSE